MPHKRGHDSEKATHHDEEWPPLAATRESPHIETKAQHSPPPPQKQKQKPMGCSKSSSKKEVYSNTSLIQETRKISNKHLTLHLKELEKEEQTKPEVGRMKEIIKIRAERNEIETKKTVVKINKTKSWFFEKIKKN